MTTRKYIGARYVPTFSDPLEWNVKTVYEPLSIVLANGQYYISRQYVPADIEVTNRDYWLPSGDAGTDVAKAVEALTLKVNSNTEAIAGGYDLINQNKNDITAGMQLIQGNTDDIATGFEMIQQVIDHFTFEGRNVVYMKDLSESASGHIAVEYTKDHKNLVIAPEIYNATGLPTEIKIAPTGFIDTRFKTFFSLMKMNNNQPVNINFNKDGSITLKTNKFSEWIGTTLIDLWLDNGNIMTLPMTEDDYMQPESEVK